MKPLCYRAALMRVLSSETVAARREIPWQMLTYAVALSVALGLCYFLVQTPLQVSDDVANMMGAEAQSAQELVASELRPGSTYFRPMLTLALNATFEVGRATGHYFLAAKTLQVAQVVALVLLFARLLRVESGADFSAASVAIVAAVGMHTFFGTVHEVYPVNTFMTILICCIAILVICDGAPAVWRDLAAVMLLALAIFTIETGILVWTIALTGFAVGFRGVSIRALGVMTAVLVGFVALKFVVLSGEIPALDQRSASFGFRSYSPQELAAAFSDRRLVFYGSNVVSSIVTVFAAEPRAGLWRVVRTIAGGEPPTLAMLLNVATSVGSSLLLFWFIGTRWPAWRQLAFQRDDRFVLVFLAVAFVNACVSFPYPKDVIVSPAGILFPLALFPALRAALRRLDGERRRGVAAGAALVLGLLSLGWTLRAAAVPYGLLRAAYEYQQEWVHIDGWLVDQGLTHYTPQQRAIIDHLRREALSMEVPNLLVVGGWMSWAERLFDRP
jgi:hypothetical protein